MIIRERITISNEQDRLTIVAILVKNGYTVRTVKVKTTPTGKAMKTVVEYWREEEQCRCHFSTDNKISIMISRFA